MAAIKTTILSFVLVIISTVTTFAQCAMCKASVENNLQHDRTSIGNDINSGILYLMVLPYIMFATIAYIWYRQSKAKKLRLQAAKIL
jgi:hypothetical protein